MGENSRMVYFNQKKIPFIMKIQAFVSIQINGINGISGINILVFIYLFYYNM